MDFRTLGSVEVAAGGRVHVPSRPMHRALLAVLLLHDGQVVAVDRLVDRLWPAGPPAGAAALVHTYASRLRRDLAGGDDPPAARLVTRRPGYALLAAPEERDSCRFEELARAAAADPARAAETAARALALWRGRPYGDVPPLPVLDAEADRLEEVRLATLEVRLEAQLAAGRAADLVTELSGLVRAHPLRERLWRLLVTALGRAGRRAEALAAYRAARERLVTDVGIEPGPELRAAHTALLADGPARPARPGPAQLPPDVADFTGRAGPLAEVLAAFGRAGPAVPVVVVSGPAGVGKTALAVHAAHRLRDRYPDGQLAVSLRGTAAPAEVLAGFLRALGVDGRAAPADLDERAAAFRSLVADRRLLLLLDDAATEAQVRPLLPGGPGCGVLVTSRGGLPGLAGARAVDLDLPPADEALALLAAVAGPDRVRAEPEAAERVVHACGRLPLAVRVAGAKLAAARHTGVARLADRLADERARMGHLVAGDLDVRSGFRVAYEQLAGPARCAFRRLGLAGLPEFDEWVVAALLDADPGAALRDLLAARLVDRARPVGTADRYRVHDLLRAYAAGLADGDPDRDAALDRLLGGWLTLTEAADRARPVGPRPAYEGPAVRHPVPVADAVADPAGWYAAERDGLLHAVELAAGSGRDHLAWAIAAAAGGPADLAQDAAARRQLATTGLLAARRTGDARAQVQMLLQAGDAELAAGRLRAGHDRLAEALELAAGDADGAAHALLGLVAAHRALDDPVAAAGCGRQALATFRALGDARGEAHTLVDLATCELQLGRAADSVAGLRAARDRLAAAGDRHGEAQASAYLGVALRQAGDLDGALAQAARTRELCLAIGDVLGGTVALRGLAAGHAAAGRPERAVPLLEQALAELVPLGHRLGQAALLVDLGAALRATGRPAEPALGLAAELFGRLGLAERRAATLSLLAGPG